MGKSIAILSDKCKGCTLCVKGCGFGAISMVAKLAVIDMAKCTLCGACETTCKFKAIEIIVDDIDRTGFEAYNDVWVYGENRDGAIAEVVVELIGEGRKLADKRGQKLAVLLIGAGTKKIVDSLFDYPVDKVYVYDNPLLKHYDTDSFTKVIEEAIKTHQPESILYGATSEGRSIAPRVAARVQTGLTADCTGLDINAAGDLAQTRPAFGGNIMATILCRTRPQMSTVRPHVMQKAAKLATPKKGDVIDLKTVLKADEITTTVIDFIRETKENVNLTEADVIVSVGRGIQGQEHIEIFKQLADALGGVLGASRAVVDAGWIDHFHQVGQTGKTVHPKIYIACGISGAIQHVAGMSSSDVVIAINKDPDATIFSIADFGIVGDVFKVVPALLRELRK